MPAADAHAVLAYLKRLWLDAYSDPVSDDLDSDLDKCARFFNPLLRGQTLRDRLSRLPDSPAPPPGISFAIGYPLVVEIGARHRLVGVEARLVIELLSVATFNAAYLSVSDADLLRLADLAASRYRGWASQRLEQVTALRSGAGAETLQAKSAGLVLGLLINRSTDRNRAARPNEGAAAPQGIEKAIFAAAEAFAARIAERNERSAREDRFKGGYAVTEARRRLRDLHIEQAAGDAAGPLYFLSPGSEAGVVTSLAAELARRPKLTEPALDKAFAALVGAYREELSRSAWLGGFYERPAETESIRRQLLAAFARIRDSKKQETGQQELEL
jgi:hypothetical protein